MDAKSYFFISHSSKDLEQVREIRNLIENLDCNPILFYLKCMDNDDPTGQDEIELKSLLYREIAARDKIIMCKSSNTEPPNETKWIAWEKKTIRELSSKIKPFEIDLSNPDYLDNVRKVVLKFKNILVASTYEVNKQSYTLVDYLKSSLTPYNINITTLYENGDMLNDIANNFGQYTKEIVKERIRQCNIEQQSLVLLLLPNNANVGTFGQMIYSLSSHYNCFFMSRIVNEDFSEQSMSSILKEVCDFLFS